ncbi:MAG: potassium transporter KefB [Cytophagales bacterium]|nr:MAG: potassium transporter KefB [Cytophagales bacterium]TAF59699.1 MAG: potassium transporter KefB [Cytophagales bacterium]
MEIFTDVMLLLGASIIVILILHRIHVPTIVGFLITGVLAGPGGFSLVEGAEEVDLLAEIGVILLLFTIGLEFSIDNLMKLKKIAAVGGSVQVVLTIIVFAAISYYFGYDYLPSATFIGFIFALSCSAIVLKVLQGRNEMKTEHGKVIFAIMVFQDFSVVIMMLVTPMMTGTAENIWLDVATLVAKVGCLILALVLTAKYLISGLLFQVARTESKELFITATVVICFAIAWLTSFAGLSLAIGAFFAGLVIAESKYSYEAAGSILPFKEVFTSVFFISIGMMMDLSFLKENYPTIILLVLLTVTLKAIIGFIAALALKLPRQTILLVGLAVCQVGDEFSFVLCKTGADSGLMPIEIYQYFLAVSIVTIGLTPMIMNLSSQFVKRLLIQKVPNKANFKNFNGNQKNTQMAVRMVTAGEEELGENHNNVANANRVSAPYDEEESLKNHMVIIGFGSHGKNIALGAQRAGIPYIIVEQNAIIVKYEVAKKEPIVFGDAAYEEVLQSADIKLAAVVVITLGDPFSTRKITYRVRKMNPNAFIIVRTRHLSEVSEMKDLGADEVITDEYETTLEMFTLALEHFFVPAEKIYQMVKLIRSFDKNTD